MHKKQLLEFLENKAQSPLTVAQITKGMGLPKASSKVLSRSIKQLVKEGALICVLGDRYGVPQRMDLISGHVQIHQNGFGFLIPDKGGEDVFLNERNLREIMDGDKVIVQVEHWEKGRKREGRVIRIVERAHQKVVGRYEKDGKIGYVTPIDPKINQDVIVYSTAGHKVRPSQLVVAEIVSYPTHQRNPEGKIIEVLGDSDTPGIDTEAIICNYNLPREFPPEVLAEAEEYPLEVEAERRRRNLRDWIIFTIDGERARDFDDAVSLTRLENGGWRLGVHIADVSHYVHPGSALDKEAYTRGTSVYFPDRVIPMLPERLSNELCSLKPNVDRLTFSAIMDYSAAGELLDYELVDSVIKSRARLTYTEVKQMLADNDPEVCARYEPLVPTLQDMNQLAMLLKQRRIEAGGLDFDLPEPEIVLDLQGNIQDIIKQERNLAHELIENFMLAANTVVATHMTKLNRPFIYRIHEVPDLMKLGELTEFVRNFGYQLELGKEVKPIHLQRLLQQIKDKPEVTTITINMLRSLKLARYSPANVGHFGLAMSDYTHFTSPIRRYPDLIVHRLLRGARKKAQSDEAHIATQTEHLNTIAIHSSLRERIAEKAERDIVSIKRTQFMASKLGEEFACIVCGISPFGIFIELEGLYVEGLIHVSNMRDDYYHFLEREHVLVGERTKQRYGIGDKLMVQIERVNIDRRQIDFQIVKRLE
ncbi:MAG: ribonuclease R [Candidatus Schekmanbacteria bacterium]|nr:ribonuclease R [Candidatus Schekmanbacteria bacterium]